MRALLLSTADTELLAARASGAGYVTANPVRIGLDELDGLTEGVDAVVVRLLGGRKTWPEGVERLRGRACPWSCWAARPTRTPS